MNKLKLTITVLSLTILLITGGIIWRNPSPFIYRLVYFVSVLNENSPKLRKHCGPYRFKWLIAEQIPKGITNIEGGYTGFPQGAIFLEFNFVGNLADYDFIRYWKPVYENDNGAKVLTHYVRRTGPEGDERIRWEGNKAFVVKPAHVSGDRFGQQFGPAEATAGENSPLPPR